MNTVFLLNAVLLSILDYDSVKGKLKGKKSMRFLAKNI